MLRKKNTGKFDESFNHKKHWFFYLTSEVSLNSFFYEVLIFDRIKYLELFQKMENTPTPWLTLLLVLGKSRVKQNSC